MKPKFTIQLITVFGSFAAFASAADITMSGATGSLWDDATTWSNGEVPTAANDYFVTGKQLNVPSIGSGSRTFSGANLSIDSGTLYMPGSSSGTVTHTYLFDGGALASTSATDPLTAIQIKDSTLSFQSNAATTKNFNARLNFTGTSNVNYSSGSWTHNLNLNRAVTGSGTLNFNWAGGATGRNVHIAAIGTTGTAHNFTGAVILNAASGTPNFNLNQGLGADSYEIRNAWRMNLKVDNGLNSASALTVTGASSILNFNNRDWANASGVLTVTDGTASIGRAVLNIASISQAAGAINLSVGGISNGSIITSGDASFDGGVIGVTLEGDPTGKNFELIHYGGTLTGTPSYLLAGDAGRLIANFSSGSGTDDKITLSFTGSAGDLVWTGDDNDDWDNNFAHNFTNDDDGLPDVFRSYDNVLFNDSTEWNSPLLVGSLTAGTVTFDGASHYTLGGTGNLVGGTSIVKNGAHTLTIANTTANTFTGDITVNGGILKAGVATALGAAVVGTGTTINSGATLDVNAQNLGAELVRITGSGVGGNGAIINTSATQQTQALRFVTLLGDATIGGIGRWDIRAGDTATLDLAGYKLTKTGANYIGVVASNITSGDIDVNQGTLAISTSSTLQGTGTVTVNAGGTLELGFGTAAANISRDLVLNGGLLLGAGTASGANSDISLSANSSVGGSAGALTLGGSISESGGAQTLSKIGTSSVILTNSSSNWTGGTIIENGTLQLNADDAAGSGTIKIGNTDTSAGTRSLTLNGATISNDVETRIMTHTGFLGTITATGSTASTVNGNVTIYPAIAGPASSGGHLVGSGGLRLMGQLNVAGGQTTIVHRTGTVEYGGGGNTAFTLQVTGTAKLAANNGISTLATAHLGASGGGTLDLSGFNQTLVGITKGANAATVTNSAATPSVLTIEGASDHSFAGTINNGNGGISLVKRGASTFTLPGAHTYTGDTTVEAGTLSLGNPFLADASAVRIVTGATLNLTHTQADTIDTLFIDGVQQAAGTYDSDNTTFITGTGSLLVTSGPSGDAFATWASTAGLDGTPGKEAGFNDDPDGDGIANGLEWILGGNPLDGNSGSLITTTASAEGGLTLAFTRNEDSVGIAALAVEYSATLAAPWASAPIGATSSGPDANGVTVTIDTAPTPDAVIVTIPASNAQAGKLFGRLKTTQP
jgi:autotransporter-associated beta strand protein